MPDSGKTQRAIVWAVVALFGMTMAAITAVALLYRGDDTAAMVASLLAAVGPTVAVLAAMRQQSMTADTVRRVERDTHALTNGLLDSKVRAGVAEVLPDELVDPAYVDTRHPVDLRAVDDAHNNGREEP